MRTRLLQNIVAWVMSFLLLLGITACSKQPTWQEQYDLGMRYLSESNYEEAVLAFTAAIEIDPNQGQTYLSRAQAYQNLSGGLAGDTLKNAQLDYEQALRLDATLVEGYLGLAEVYRVQGNLEKAAEILQQGINITGDTRLKTALEKIRRQMDPYLLDEVFAERDGYRAFNTLSTEEQELIRQSVELLEQGRAEQLVQQMPTGMNAHFFTMYDQYKVELRIEENLPYQAYKDIYVENPYEGFIALGPGMILQIRPEEGQGYLFVNYSKWAASEETISDSDISVYEVYKGECKNWQFEGSFSFLGTTVYTTYAYDVNYGQTEEAYTNRIKQISEETGVASENILNVDSIHVILQAMVNGNWRMTSENEYLAADLEVYPATLEKW